MRPRILGVMEALWWTLRAISCVLLAFLAIDGTGVSTPPPGLDATPLVSFLLIVVAPLAGIVLIGVSSDMWILLQERGVHSRRLRTATAIIGIGAIGGLLVRLVV